MTVTKRVGSASVLAILVAALTCGPSAASPKGDPFRARGEGSTYLIEGAHESRPSADASISEPSGIELRRAPYRTCGFNMDFTTAPRLDPDCTDGTTLQVNFSCESPNVAVDPMFRRSRDPASANGWGPWEMVDNGCLPSVDIAGAVAREFQQLPLTPSPLSIQPPSGWTLVNAETVAFADDRPQILSTTVLGINIAVQAAPATYTWSFGDGSTPIVTTEPGQPWPNHTVSHRYGNEGTRSINLVTTWSGTFQIAGTTEWRPVDGTATTTSTSPPLVVYEARSRLVDGLAN